jgi:hypothetical protein
VTSVLLYLVWEEWLVFFVGADFMYVLVWCIRMCVMGRVCDTEFGKEVVGDVSAVMDEMGVDERVFGCF